MAVYNVAKCILYQDCMQFYASVILL